ncbi:MAG TPA: hypothetical protein VJN64_03555 [Terriglobales bacterium]|nr:hypothetical protein [Terriglobales bacterium]
MFRRALLVAAISVSLAAMSQAQAGGAKGGASSSGSTGTAGATPSAPGAVSNPGIPMTQGAVGGLAGQAGAGTVALPGANQIGAPTVPETISGPAGTTGTTQGNPNSVNTTGTVTNGFVGGFAGGVLATPTASFAAPQPTAGISLADRSGISTSTPVETGVQMTLSPSTLVYTNIEPVNPMAVTTNPSALGGPVRDFGPSYYAGAGPVSSAPSMATAVSLGEVAAKLKGERPTQNVRTYTNADVQRINENMRLQGVNVNARLQQNAQPAASNSQVASVPAAEPQGQQPQLSASARPSPAIRPEQAQSAPASSAPAANQSQETSTIPQVNQPKPVPPSEQQSSRQLPATSTLLPLLGIIGLASGGIGLVFRKYRK